VTQDVHKKLHSIPLQQQPQYMQYIISGRK